MSFPGSFDNSANKIIEILTCALLASTIRAVLQALIDGLAAQWLVDPNSPPSGKTLREAIQAIATTVT